jgi:hypothetical protein
MCPKNSDVGKISKTKVGRFKITPGSPIDISEFENSPTSNDTDLNPELRQITKTIKSYLTEVRKLTEGRLSHLRELVPAHMTESCTPMAFVFSDGVLVRYDLKDNPDLKVFAGVIQDEGTITEWAPLLTENFLHCPVTIEGYDPGRQMASITLSVVSPAENKTQNIATSHIFSVVPLTALKSMSVNLDSNRLMPAVSVNNEFDLHLEMEIEPLGGEKAQKVITRTPFRLPFGWEAVELFPSFNMDSWEPGVSSLRAERDMYAAVARRNLQDEKYRDVDPNAQARKLMAELIKQYESLLSGAEEPIHQFIKNHPQLLCPAYSRFWSKLPLGKHVTDFVFHEAAGGYLLVELEKPTHSLFRKDGQPRQQLNHAIDQIMDWRRYIEHNLSTVQRELGLEGLSSNPSCLVVIGRSSSLTEENQQKLTSMENASPSIKIMTYDDVLANAKAVSEHLLGPLWDFGPNTEVYFRS